MKAKLFLFLIIFIISTKAAFADDYQLSGRVLDQNKSPISNSVIVFITNNGKTLKAAKTDLSGFYQVEIPKGEYTIQINGPKGTNIEGTTLPNTIINSSSNMDFILKTQEIPKSTENIKAIFIPIMIGIILGLLIVIIFIWFLFKRRGRKDLPESSSSN